MKKIIAVACAVLLVVAILVTPPSAVKADSDCKGNSCLVATPDCGEVECAKDTDQTVSNSGKEGKSCEKNGIFSCKSSRQTLSGSGLTPPVVTPQRAPTKTPEIMQRNCIKTLTCIAKENASGKNH